MGTTGVTTTDNAAVLPAIHPAAKPPLTKKLAPHRTCRRTSRHGVRGRRCAYDRNGKLYKVCTWRKGWKRYHCARRPVKAGRCRRGGAGAPDPAGRGAFARSVVSQGWVSKIIPAVGRFYAAESSLSNKGWCSGTLVLRGVVLTAGHCVYANGLDKAPDGTTYHYYDASKMVFTPGNTINPANPIWGSTDYGNWTVRHMWASGGWGADDQTADWALVELNPDANGRYPGDITGTYPVYYGLSLTVGQKLEAIGYPASNVFRTSSYFTGNGQYFVDSTITGGQACTPHPGVTCSSLFINFDSAMTGGSSGGPIFYLDSDGQYKISGVVNRGQVTGARADDADFGQFQLTAYMDSTFNDFYNYVIAQINAGV